MVVSCSLEVFRWCLNLLQTSPAALVGGGKSHGLAIFRDRATGHRYPFPREQLGNAAVAQRVFRVLVLDELLDLGANGGRGGAGTVDALDLTGEKIAQFENPARGVHVLAGSDPRDSRFVHRDRFGDVLED